jgi:putative SbcD/Mre11-related phosphoesterase
MQKGPRFVTNEPALLIGRTLVVSDLHLGIEYEFYQSGIKVPSQTEKIQKRLDRLLDVTKAKALVFLGDTKHKVPGISYQETREIPELLDHFSGRVRVVCIMGNHDPGLEDLAPKGVEIRPTEGFLLGNVYLNHGHTWPGKDFLKAKFIVIGHLQPQIQFRNRLGYVWREHVWARTSLNKDKLKKRYGKVRNLPELIIMPAFNPFAGGLTLNKKGIFEERDKHNGPIVKTADTKKAKIYLLDGTYLGELKGL